MSADTAHRVGVQREHRMLNLGQAIPISSAVPGEKRPVASEGKKHSQISAEHQEWLDGQETTSRCTECPDWSFTGPASEARTASAAHRVELHPELVGRRTARRGRSVLTRGAKTAQQIADIAGAKAARLERDRVELEERLETTAQRVNTVLEEAPGTTGAGPGVSSSTTPPDQEEPMPAKTERPQTREAIIAAVSRFVDEHGRMPLPSDTADNDYLPHKQFHEKTYAVAAGFPSWQALWDHFDAGKIPQGRGAAKYRGTVVAAKSKHAPHGAAAPPARVPQPTPEPEPALPPAAEHAELVPVDAAPPGHTSSRLVQILARLTSEDLEESADWYAAAIGQLEHERNLIAQAIEAKAA